MMDTYWLEGVRGAINTSPKNENKNTRQPTIAENDEDAKENVEHTS